MNLSKSANTLLRCFKYSVERPFALIDNPRVPLWIPVGSQSLSTSTILNGGVPTNPTHWLEYNKKIFPPQKPGEEKRPAVSTYSLLLNNSVPPETNFFGFFALGGETLPN